MKLVDYAALSPLLLLLGGALTTLFAETFFSKPRSAWVAAVSILAALLANLFAPTTTHPRITTWLLFDQHSLIFSTLFLLIGLFTTLLAAEFFQRLKVKEGEYYFFLLCSLFGLILIGSAADFLTLFLGLETVSISLYLSVNYLKRVSSSHEAAVKYFIVGSVAAAVLLYGIALIYGSIGTTNLSQLSGYSQSNRSLFLAGIGLITAALCCKAAIVPLHMWAPDVYAESPIPVTAFMAVGAKVGVFAAFAHLFLGALPHFDPLWSGVVVLFIYLTLLFSSLMAITQKQLKRFFAYSSMSHSAFLLIPIAVGGNEAFSALLFYLAVYSSATLGCFVTLTSLSTRGVVLQDVRGLFTHSPYMALFFSFCLVTLSGAPPAAGFFAKLYVFKVAYAKGYYLLIAVSLLTTVLSTYYYLRIIALMMKKGEASTTLSAPLLFAAILLSLSLFALLLFPSLLLSTLGFGSL